VLIFYLSETRDTNPSPGFEDLHRAKRGCQIPLTNPPKADEVTSIPPPQPSKISMRLALMMFLIIEFG